LRSLTPRKQALNRRLAAAIQAGCADRMSRLKTNDHKERSMRRPGGAVRPVIATVFVVLSVGAVAPLAAAPVPGGTLNPLNVPKYVTPLTIPPEMPPASVNRFTGARSYDIEVLQFKQQILPKTGINGAAIPATTVWSYAVPGQPGTRRYPALTIEARKDTKVSVNWINSLKDGAGNFLPHLLPIDQTLHWANPARANACVDENGNPTPAKVKDCRTLNGKAYKGPVPIVTHVHGAHVGPESDGYPEAWYLPKAKDIDCTRSFSCFGSLTNSFGVANTSLGQARFSYPNDQASTTLWYHDHTLGMTRANVYAGPAGFWLLRDPSYAGGETGLVGGSLPAPAPQANDRSGTKYYEIPLLIQDRSFNADGSLFYPSNRAFFEGLKKKDLAIPFLGNRDGLPSDISPTWNPETFFNVMVVNGASWPYHAVDPRRYRLRLLNGSNSRFLNLALFVVGPGGALTPTELPFYQIGGDQGLLPKVVKVTTGFATELPGNGTEPAPTPAEAAERALLLAPSERADVIVDFTGLARGTRVRLINTAPDAPFGGFNGDPAADPDTTGQVMEFVVGSEPRTAERSTPPASLRLAAYDPRFPVLPPIGNAASPRRVSLNEESSAAVCVSVADTGAITYIPGVPVSNPFDAARFEADCTFAGGTPMGPKAAKLGTVDVMGAAMAMMWADRVTENPAVGATEQWDIYNNTEDAHPVHLHLVQFKVLSRRLAVVDPANPGAVAHSVSPAEQGWKDTVIAYPGEITSVAATFDREGLYVWHCHILEHEDNEMMRPYCVGNPANCPR
jgi:FtsP/CotA-like multicopper oxidase with cupredoxin domain